MDWILNYLYVICNLRFRLAGLGFVGVDVLVVFVNIEFVGNLSFFYLCLW